MRKIGSYTFGFFLFASFLLATPAEASHARFYFGFSCCGYYQSWAPYPYYYTAYAPPSVVYVAPPSAEPMYVVEPEPPLAVNPASPIYSDDWGRLCRRYQTMNGENLVYGTACLDPNGVWRSVL